jgi:hypothetical protein
VENNPLSQDDRSLRKAMKIADRLSAGDVMPDLNVKNKRDLLKTWRLRLAARAEHVT